MSRACACVGIVQQSGATPIMNQSHANPLDRPVLTLKNGIRRDSSSRPKPLQVLRRRHSRVACTVFVKHAHGVRENPSS
jgi:hypothetical protein